MRSGAVTIGLLLLVVMWSGPGSDATAHTIDEVCASCVAGANGTLGASALRVLLPAHLDATDRDHARDGTSAALTSTFTPFGSLVVTLYGGDGSSARWALADVNGAGVDAFLQQLSIELRRAVSDLCGGSSHACTAGNDSLPPAGYKLEVTRAFELPPRSKDDAREDSTFHTGGGDPSEQVVLTSSGHGVGTSPNSVGGGPGITRLGSSVTGAPITNFSASGPGEWTATVASSGAGEESAVVASAAGAGITRVPAPPTLVAVGAGMLAVTAWMRRARLLRIFRRKA